MALPLANTRSAGIRHYRCANIFESGNHAVAFSSSTYLLRAGIDNQRGSNLQILFLYLPGKGGRTAQILIGRIGARPYQTDFHPAGIVIGYHYLGKFRYRCCCIRRKGPIDIRFQQREVYFNDAVVIFFRICQHFVVGAKVGSYGSSHFCHFFTSGSLQISTHALIVREKGGSRPHLCPHIADGSLSSGRQRSGSRSKIFNDGIGSPFYSKNTRQLQNNVFGSYPATQFTLQVYAYQTRHFQFPFHAGHHIHRIGTTHTNGHHAQTSGIGRMRVRAYHHSTRKCVVLQYHLVNNACSRLPKTYAIAGGNITEKIIDLLVGLRSSHDIFFCTFICLNQMVTVHSGRHGNLLTACIHKLQ